MTYDTFGTLLNETNEDLHVSIGFAGGLRDKDTSRTRFGYRDYDSSTGKWTAKDPIGFQGGDTNLYRYVMGDPVNLVDPEGEFAWIAAGAGAGFVGGVGGYYAAGGRSFSKGFKAGLVGAAGGAITGALAPINTPIAIGFDALWGLTNNALTGIDGAVSDEKLEKCEK